LGAVYACLKCFSPRFNAQLKCIFLALLFHSDDPSVFGSDAIFQSLVEEIKIHIMVAGVEYEIKFLMVQILGDNLGLNSLLGYTESFSANHYCLCVNMYQASFADDQEAQKRFTERRPLSFICFYFTFRQVSSFLTAHQHIKGYFVPSRLLWK